MATLIVLAGGRGRRMGGVDKSRLLLEGRTFLDRILDRLGPLFDETLIAGGPGLPDLHPGGGPTQGVAAGLAAMAGEVAFVCACDMPHVQPRVVQRLLERLGPREAVVPVLDGRPQPLHAVYRRSCAGPARDLAREPGRRMLDLLERVDCLLLSEEELLDLPDWRRSFENANTPEDLERL